MTQENKNEIILKIENNIDKINCLQCENIQHLQQISKYKIGDKFVSYNSNGLLYRIEHIDWNVDDKIVTYKLEVMINYVRIDSLYFDEDMVDWFLNVSNFKQIL